METESVLGIKDLSFSYNGERPIFDRLTISLRAGQLFGISGPSGSGKSTLLRLIAGLQKPTGGKIQVRWKSSSASLPISMMFQDSRLLPWLNAYENIAFALGRLKISKIEVKDRVLWALARVGLSELSMRYPHELSGGQQQRISLARALVVHSPVLLLDEPFSSLDQGTRLSMLQLVQEVVRERNIAAVMVSHQREDFIGLADYELDFSLKNLYVELEGRHPCGSRDPGQDSICLTGSLLSQG